MCEEEKDDKKFKALKRVCQRSDHELWWKELPELEKRRNTADMISFDSSWSLPPYITSSLDTEGDNGADHKNGALIVISEVYMEQIKHEKKNEE